MVTANKIVRHCNLFDKIKTQRKEIERGREKKKKIKTELKSSQKRTIFYVLFANDNH